MYERAKDNYLRRLVETDTCSAKLALPISQSVNSSKITRSQSSPYERNIYVFFMIKALLIGILIGILSTK